MPEIFTPIARDLYPVVERFKKEADDTCLLPVVGRPAKFYYQRTNTGYVLVCDAIPNRVHDAFHGVKIVETERQPEEVAIHLPNYAKNIRQIRHYNHRRVDQLEEIAGSLRIVDMDLVLYKNDLLNGSLKSESRDPNRYPDYYFQNLYGQVRATRNWALSQAEMLPFIGNHANRQILYLANIEDLGLSAPPVLDLPDLTKKCLSNQTNQLFLKYQLLRQPRESSFLD